MVNNLMKKKIVIVEDQPSLRNLIKMSLDIREHYEIHEAGDAQMGMKLIEAVQPDLVFLDVMMPGEFDGFMLCDILKSTDQYRDVHIVILTALGSNADRKSGMLSGADHYLVKPFMPDDLLQLTDNILGQTGGDGDGASLN